MSITFAEYQPAFLPWSFSKNEDGRFRRILGMVLLSCLFLSLMISWLPRPKSDPNKVEPLPERFAKLLLEQAAPPPPPPPATVKPAEPQTTTPTKPRDTEANKPQDAKQEAARRKASGAGLLALSKELSALADSSNVSTMVATKLNTAPASTAAATVDTRILTSDTGRTSVGVSKNAHVGTVGNTKLDDGARQATTTALLAASGGDGTGKAGGGTPGGTGQGANARRYEDVAVVMDQNKGTLYTIYNRARRSDPGLKGKIVLLLTIQPSGQVTSITIKSSELNSPELEAALVARIRQFDFGKRVGGPLTISIPVEFLPS